MRDSYSADEVTQIENKAYETGHGVGFMEGKEEGFFIGMGKAHEATWRTISRLQGALSDVQSIYDRMDFQPVDSSIKLNELQHMWETLEAFRDMFVDAYDSEIDEAKAQKEGKGFINFKDEWPE